MDKRWLRALWVGLLLGAIVMKSAGAAQADTDAELNALNDQVITLFKAGKYAEAVPVAEHYAAAVKASHGAASAQYVNALAQYVHALDVLSQLYQAQGHLPEAEPLMKRALAITEKALGPDDPTVGTRLNGLAVL